MCKEVDKVPVKKEATCLLLSGKNLSLSPLLLFSLSFSPSLLPPSIDFLAFSLNKKLIMGKVCSWSLG